MAFLFEIPRIKPDAGMPVGVYIRAFHTGQMSALVWAVESVLLGLWALVLAQYATPFHSFIAYSHAPIAAATLAAHLFASARDLDIGHAISESFVCATSGLCMVYVMALLDPGNYEDPRMFSMSVVDGLLPLDACIGLGWLSAALTSALGMTLSVRGRKYALMFHHFGYHMLVVPPSFLVFWLYNYDGQASEPVSQGIALLYQGVRVTHFLYTLVLIGIWGVFVVLQATGESIQNDWPDFAELTAAGEIRYTLAVILKLVGRLACILIPVSAAFTARTRPQTIMAWVLTGLGAVNSIDWLVFVDRWFSAKPDPLEQEEVAQVEQLTARPDPAAVTLHWRDKNV